jgi:cell division protein FtsB
MQAQLARFICCLAIVPFFGGVSSARQGAATESEQQSLHQRIAELQQKIEDANDRHAADIKMLRQEIDALKHDPNEAPSAAAQSEYEQRSPWRMLQSFNPDTSVIGDVLFHAGENEQGENENQFSFRELELAFGSAVDPYGRADFFVAIDGQDGEFAIDVEEGYFTFDTLGHDLKARVGKFYSAFGKANQFHTHAMPWVDRPLVIRHFFGEEGMSEPGAELSWLVPNPCESYMELTGQLQSNRNAASLAGDEGDDLIYVTHLKNFFDINRQSTIDVGGSFATGRNARTGEDRQTYLEGLDLTYKWRPPEQGLYKSLTWMNEVLLSQRQQGEGDTVDSYGLYSSLEYQFDRRWSVFGRYDYAQFPEDSDSHESAYTPGLTFRQSEYAFWRLQYTHTEGSGDLASGTRDELFLQLDFGIGPHRAHQY